jgi:adenylate kinase family enzyme
MKIVITGTPCAGKTTLARHLSHHLKCPHIEIDSYLFSPQWMSLPVQQIHQKVTDLLQSEAHWVFDGNKAREIVWDTADMIIWLDYPLHVLLWRAACRTIQRCIKQEALWNGNREHFLYHFTHRNSIFLIVFRDWKNRHEHYPFPFIQYPHVRIIRFRSPKETQRWLSWFEPGSQPATCQPVGNASYQISGTE